MRILLIVGLMAGAANADECGAWRSEVWETEGGMRTTAYVCSETATEREALLFVQCDDADTYALFYDDGGLGAPPGSDADYTGVFSFKTEETTLDLTMTYQGLDGTYYASMPKGVLERLFLSGPELVITPTDEGIYSQDFVMLGSATALVPVLADCLQ